MRSLHFFFILLCLLLSFTACQQEQGQDIARSIDHLQMEETEGIVPVPSNKEQNKRRVNTEQATVTYAEHFGYYLDQVYLKLDEMKELFYENVSNEELQVAKSKVNQVQQLSDQHITLLKPEQFEGLHLVHISFLVELESLASSLENFDVNNETHLRRARLYYENAVIALKQMEREFKTVLEEQGIK